MSYLEPHFVATLASDIYGVKDEDTREDFLAAYEGDLEVGSENYLEGSTGALILLKSSHIMGVAGIGKGKYKHQAFVVVKGTASGFDALTDLNAGLKRSCTGGQVHQGFFYTFSCFLPQLMQFKTVLSKHNIHTIHCIGHSLGGALATLAADWLSANTSSSIKLYTFGSPRVGLSHFASNCTRRIKPENVYRVFHKTDPVPMVPTWPFTHVPDKGTDYLLDSSLSLPPWKYHFMAHYIDSTSENGTSLSWLTLKAKRPPELLDSSIEAWLKSEGPVSLTLNTARVLDAALIWVLKKIANLAGIALVGSFSTVFTILDRLAYMMHKAYEFSKELSIWVVRLIKRMGQMLGIVITKSTQFTLDFIRKIFLSIHQQISELVRKASDAIID